MAIATDRQTDMMDEDDSFTSPETMLAFYKHLYPFESIYLWLNHNAQPTRQFTHREFAFTLPGDVYLRYNSFTNAADMKKSVLQLNPSRFEVGPVYTVRVRVTSSHIAY
jgi:DNA primase small subunit